MLELALWSCFTINYIFPVVMAFFVVNLNYFIDQMALPTVQCHGTLSVVFYLVLCEFSSLFYVT